jgi:hypothetical protein
VLDREERGGGKVVHTVEPRRPPCRPLTGTWMAGVTAVMHGATDGVTCTRRCATVRRPWRALSARCERPQNAPYLASKRVCGCTRTDRRFGTRPWNPEEKQLRRPDVARNAHAQSDTKMRADRRVGHARHARPPPRPPAAPRWSAYASASPRPAPHSRSPLLPNQRETAPPQARTTVTCRAGTP